MNTRDPSTSPDLTRAIADFAFGSQVLTHGSRPLAWLSPDEMKIDLADPQQRRFGDYELLERIGHGGMGVVYRARQHGLERDVAVKLLAAGPWASDEFVARFRREARNAARMQHPNIVEIYEFGHRDGLNYFSMRLVEGPSLAQRLAANGPMPEREAAKCARLLAEAMDYAHRLDVLHLDLKPANVLIGRAGEPLIADFGLARRIDAGGAGGQEEISGTPSYMAPEQAQHASHPLSASTDIYGLGAVLYEMLTARPPFRGENAQATLDSVIAEQPKLPRSLRAGLSPDLEAICLRCLEKSPVDRYSSARELADDLQRFLDGHPVSAHPLSWSQRLGRWARREPKLAAAVAAALLALALGGAATAFAWQKARGMQADAEYLGLASILPSASNTSLYALADDIRQRLTEDARRTRARELIRSSDPQDWLAASLVAYSLPEPDNTGMGDGQLDRAVRAMPNDRFALIMAVRYCNAGFAWYDDEGNYTTNLQTPCPVKNAAARLTELDPQNLYGWLSLIDPSDDDPQQKGKFLYQNVRERATRERIGKLVAAAARSSYYDAGYARALAIKSRALGVDYFPMPLGLIYQSPYSKTNTAERLKQGLWTTWMEAWDNAGWLHFPVLEAYCDPDQSTLDESTRADCMRIFRTLAEGKSDMIVTIAGWRGMARLSKGTVLEAELNTRYEQFRWIREQQVWTRERDPRGRAKQYLKDLMAVGEIEATLLEADRLGIPRRPPVGWRPLRTWPLIPKD
jgi:hypothetical protein